MSKHYVGLDVSLDQSSLCVVDAAGIIVSETKLDTDPDEIVRYLQKSSLVIERVGLEAGPLFAVAACWPRGARTASYLH